MMIFSSDPFPNVSRIDFLSVCLQTVCHGFPYQPTSMAYDAVQNILAIGTKCGRVRMYPFLDEQLK